MLFAVIFSDKPDHGRVRAAHLGAHVRWVNDHKDVVLVAGSLREELTATPKGGLWIVEAESRDVVIELMKTDPFHVSGLRESVEILHWNKALPDHKALV